MLRVRIDIGSNHVRLGLIGGNFLRGAGVIYRIEQLKEVRWRVCRYLV